MAVSGRRGFLVSMPLAVVVALAGAPAAHAAPRITVSGGKSQPVFSYADAVREYVNVQSPVDADGDGKKDLIRVDIIRPKESGPSMKVPVIMDESPYYDNLGRGNESERKTYDSAGNPVKFPLFYDNYFVPRGYAVLDVDMDGTTKSDGCPTSGGPSDVAGGKAVIDWLNGRATAYDASGKPVKASWTTGKTAMIGKSYDGTLANAVAATGVEGLETIVPISAISSWYDYSRMGGVDWWKGEEDGLARVVDTDPPGTCAKVRQSMATGQDDASGNYNAFWSDRDYRADPVPSVDKVHAAVFATHGLNDLNVKPNQFSTWWAGLAKRGVPRKVWLSQYGHVDPFDFGPRRDLWVDTLHQWFDHWLLGVRNGVMAKPRVDLETGPDQWTTQADWPAPGAHALTLHPRANGELAGTADSGTAAYTDARIAESGAVADPTAANPDRLAYVTPALKAPLRISGTPKMSVKITADKPTATLGALLVDYGSATRVNYLGAGSGITTLTDEDCHGDSTTDDDACYKKTATDTITSDVNVIARGFVDAQNRGSLSEPAPLTPGKSYAVSWPTLPQDYRLPAGHRLGLVLLGTDGDLIEDAPTGAKVTVDLAGSGLSLPVTTGTAPKVQPRTTWHGPADVHLPRQPHRFQ